jgi:hypothetical protein
MRKVPTYRTLFIKKICNVSEQLSKAYPVYYGYLEGWKLSQAYEYFGNGAYYSIISVISFYMGLIGIRCVKTKNSYYGRTKIQHINSVCTSVL